LGTSATQGRRTGLEPGGQDYDGGGGIRLSSEDVMPGRIVSLFQNLLRKNVIERELDEELQSSVELMIEEKVKQGLTPAVARRQALMELGGIEQTKEEVRAVRAGHVLEEFV